MKPLLFCFLFPLQILAQDTLIINRYIDSLMEPVNRNDMPASLLVIAKDGKPIVRKAYGMVNLELAAPAKPEHLFTLASVNKQMIAVCILQLAQQGNLKLSDDIRKYFPNSATHEEVITIEQLLNHTSGIYSGNSPVRGKSFFEHSTEAGVLSDKEFLDYTMKVPLLFKPGIDWSWNTWAFHVAFLIIEKVSAMPFNDYVRKYLFQPAGMNNSFSKVDGNRLGFYGIKNLNTSFYYRDFDGKWVWRDNRRLLPYILYQRYSIVTSLDDLVKWDQALREGKLLEGEWLKKAWTSGQLKDGRTINYGLGWVTSEQDGYRLISHIGIGTNPICIVHVPKERLYIAYTQFFGTVDQVELKVKKILAHLLPLTYPVPAKAESPLTDYVGVYEVHRNGLDIAEQLSDKPIYINISVTYDTLYLQQTAGEKFALRPAGKDRFLPSSSENNWYVFKRNEKGKITAIINRGTFWTYGPEVLNKRVNKSWPQPVTPKFVASNVLKKYNGLYYLASFDSYVFIETDGTRLHNKVQGRQQELIAVAENKFVRKGAEDISFEFKFNASGTTKLIITGLRPLEYKKID